MIARLLIANRGEIARRVIRTARRMGVETVAVFSDADARAPHVREADAAVRLGPPQARESYLDIAKVIAAARESGADSVHPGYGFLSENADFAEAVEAAGLVWVGPPPAAIRAMGPKDEAKRIMEGAGVPVTPGWRGEDQSSDNLAARAAEVGFPVLIKAVSGGGGKGMRRVDRAEDFGDALASAQREGAASFGDDRVLIERYAQRPRHIEVQVFADAHGNVVHLFERDCSLQRRHQKVIEEAPAPGMTAQVRESVCASAVAAARAVGYRGAGTVEFIADASEGLRADRIWFMEMNTRLQVEHPVTEMVTGLDLVEWQLRVAAGEPLPRRQDQIALNGWAMEARLYAENPSTGFLPSTGRLTTLDLPSSVDDLIRVDSGVEEGDEVSPFYDPMLAKLIVHRPERREAARLLQTVCEHVRVWPVRTNAAFLARCLGDPAFLAGEVDTGFIPDRLDRLVPPIEPPAKAVDAFVSDLRANTYPGPRRRETDPLDAPALTGFRLNAERRRDVAVWADGTELRGRLDDRQWPFAGEPLRDGDALVSFHKGQPYVLRAAPPLAAAASGAASDGQLLAPMPGRVVQLAVVPGQRVAKGAPVVTLEAMKMEHGLTAPFDGVIAEAPASVGQQVAEGALLVRLERSAPPPAEEGVNVRGGSA